MSFSKPQGQASDSVTSMPDSTRARSTSIGAIPRPNTHAPSSGAMQALPNGTMLQNRYMIEAVLGTGGMSVVYRGRDLRFKEVTRHCAIKEMFQTAPDSTTRVLRLRHFEREAGLLATLSHPAIPKVYDFFEENGRVYVIMELVAATDLQALLQQHGKPFDEARVGGWALQLCDVLHYLHTAAPEPVIFRDLKPSNIMLTPDERIVLIDFGIARVFEQQQGKGTLIGTEGYAPPEQYRGVVDPRGDLYALGATLHHLLTNTDPRTEPPFTFHERSVRLFNPNVSEALEAVLAQTLHYDLEQRLQSAADLKQSLLAVPALKPLGAEQAYAGALLRSRVRDATTELVWRFPCGDEVRSSPHVHNDVVYIGSYDKHLYALDAATGAQRWRRATLGGVSSSPAVWNDLVFVGSEDGSIYALGVRNGAPRWSMRTERAIRSSPRVLDRVVYVGSDDQHVYALDGLSGRVLWKYRTWMPVRSSCAIKDGLVAVGSSDGHVYGLDAASGTLRWKQRTLHGVISSPVITDHLVIVGSMDQNVYALDVESGRPVWRFRTEHYVNASPYVADGRVFVGGVDGNMYALEAKSGRLVWKRALGCHVTSSARVAAGKLYVGGTDGSVRCIEADGGAPVWTYQTEGAVVSSPAFAEGVVYVGSLDRHVYALEA